MTRFLRPLARIAGGLLVVAASLDAIRAQEPQATFHAGTELVAIDVLAIAGARPVADPRVDELKRSVDRRARDIRHLQFIRLARNGGAEGGDHPGESGRTIIFAFDDDIQPGNELAARSAAVKLLTRLAPADRIDLRVSRRGVTLHARPEFEIPKLMTDTTTSRVPRTKS